MNECPKCGAIREWKTRRDTAQSNERKFLSHPKGGCHKYVNDKLKNRCNLFEQDFGMPKKCEGGCGREIYCFESKIGITSRKICFDTPGPPWINHDCQKTGNPAEPAVGYKSCVICAYVSTNWTHGYLKQHFLGFQIQIQKDGFQTEAFIVVSNPKDNKQFVDDLHQPFFYKEIAHTNWTLSTYREICDASGRVLYVPKEYPCWKVDHESIKNWKAVFENEMQHCLDLRSKDLK